MTLICMPLMVRDVQHFFMYLLAIYVSFEKCLSRLPISQRVICFLVIE
jgi:hypothetical protein